jgi:hypothetical protein
MGADPVVAEWFLRRFSLLDSLYMISSARPVGRTIRHNLRLWRAERRGRAKVNRSAPEEIMSSRSRTIHSPNTFRAPVKRAVAPRVSSSSS